MKIREDKNLVDTFSWKEVSKILKYDFSDKIVITMAHRSGNLGIRI